MNFSQDIVSLGGCLVILIDFDDQVGVGPLKENLMFYFIGNLLRGFLVLCIWLSALPHLVYRAPWRIDIC